MSEASESALAGRGDASNSTGWISCKSIMSSDAEDAELGEIDVG